MAVVRMRLHLPLPQTLLLLLPLRSASSSLTLKLSLSSHLLLEILRLNSIHPRVMFLVSWIFTPIHFVSVFQNPIFAIFFLKQYSLSTFPITFPSFSGQHYIFLPSIASSQQGQKSGISASETQSDLGSEESL
ncbi:hypothetical protein VNO77_02415 [Canavalia gladiata]|uniref:Uncharacterized protein n=1 Tax=Canavalia gladiata TaxID=3824 RepID=A0AAN9R5X7_CANGL